ncbi:DUF2007 domain-containing protein [Aliishimia ponticola]|uniref:DUF2007 domain-containing protein n=1 Tax=Aliishimia ponticola TaxID=2499833 RepID=A0A4S4NC16_9RHOB|nr:DUF2007 domain-containing protein [Aliishimia ponticola]THH36954.1 DUF2007 domain-containing protein [Aliishimia ponticola]
MKELLRTSDPTVAAFAKALLAGEDIMCFELDVNISNLYGGLDVFPIRMMVREDDYARASIAMRDNGIEVSP